MKLNYICNIAALSMLMLSACTQDDVLTQGEENALNPDAFSIRSVKVADFGSENASRATNDGTTVTFGNGDTMGLLLIENGAATLNAPFEYQDGTWNNVNNASYSRKIEKAIAYFPYDETLTLVATVEDLKTAKDWNTAEDFAGKDLLVAEIDVEAPELEVNFKHAFSLISLSAKGSVTVGEETYEYPLTLSDVSFSIGDTQYTPDVVNGEYLCLVDENELKTNDFRYFYTVGEATYAKTVDGAISLEPNHKYSFPCATSATGESAVAAGDFYCVSDGGTVVVIPNDAASLPTGLTCKGIVFHVMTGDEWSTFTTTNGLTATDYPGYNQKHGLIVSLKYGEHFAPTSEMGGDKNATILANVSTIVSSIDKHDDTGTSNGYALTDAILKYEEKAFTFTALGEYADDEVKNATAWYLPSFNEAKYLIIGTESETVTTDGQTYINGQLRKVQDSEELAGNFPSVTLKTDGFCIMENGNEMGWHGLPDGNEYRPICAF